MSNSLRILFAALLLCTATASLSACNTVEGMGEDIEQGGENLQDAAE